MPAEDQPAVEIQDVPSDTPPERLPEVINSRFRRLKTDLVKFVMQGSRVAVDVGRQRIIHVADPKNDEDAVNLRTLKRSVAPIRHVEDQPAKKTVAAVQPYSMVFTKDGFVNDDEESPFFGVDDGNQGSIASVLVAARVAPSTGPLKVNWRVQRPGELEASDLLVLPLTLEVDSKGPEFGTEIAIRDALPKGTLVYMVIVEGGSAEQVTGQVFLKRNGLPE